MRSRRFGFLNENVVESQFFGIGQHGFVFDGLDGTVQFGTERHGGELRHQRQCGFAEGAEGVQCATRGVDVSRQDEVADQHALSHQSVAIEAGFLP